jgi:hypothetical protein
MSDELQAKYATVADVAVELGETITPGTPKAAQVQRWLNRVERQIRGTVTQLDSWCTDDVLYKAIVNDVEVAAVERKARNPDGMRSIMTQVDDANVQQTIDTSRSTGEITILPSEWSQLLKSNTTNMMSIMAEPQPDSFPLPRYW